MEAYRVYLNDGTSYETSINGTQEEIEAYFVGQWLNMGRVKDNMKRCIRVEKLENNMEIK